MHCTLIDYPEQLDLHFNPEVVRGNLSKLQRAFILLLCNILEGSVPGNEHFTPRDFIQF